MIFISIITFLVILAIVVFIHELGHFWVARKNGVLVEEFGLGMPPRMFGVQKTDKGWHVIKGTKAPEDITKTIYSLNWLPLGGFVKLYGDGAGGEGGHVDPRYESLALNRASVWGRCAIMAAGVIMNLILAITIYYGLLMSHGFVSERIPLIMDMDFRFGKQIESVGVIAVRKDSPADVAGVKVQSIVIRIRPYITCDPGTICDIYAPWRSISGTQDLINTVKEYDGQPIEIEMKKSFLNPETYTVVVTPQYDKEAKRAIIGIQLVKFVSLDYTAPTDRIFAGFLHAWNLTAYNFTLQGHILRQAVLQRDASIASDAVGGPVAIASVVNDTIKESGADMVKNLLGLMALISLSLAYMNILPIPALDGGRIALLIPEMITGRRVPHKFENYLNIGGFIALIGLSIVITFKDIFNLFR